MKTNQKSILVLLTLLLATACEKNAVQVIDDPDALTGANVKFFNFAVGSPQVNFYVNDKKATATSATGCFILDDQNRQACLSTGMESTVGVGYGSAANGPNAWYSEMPTGNATISGKIAEATDKNVAISDVQTSLQAGKFYSFYQSGTYDPATKRADGFIIEDVIPARDFNVAHVRFVNASSTAAPMTLFVKNRVTGEEFAIGGSVAYKTGSEFIAIPVGSYDLATRTQGSTVNVFARTQVSFFAGRAYTVAARGNTATASTMLLDNTANR